MQQKLYTSRMHSSASKTSISSSFFVWPIASLLLFVRFFFHHWMPSSSLKNTLQEFIDSDFIADFCNARLWNCKEELYEKKDFARFSLRFLKLFSCLFRNSSLSLFLSPLASFLSAIRKTLGRHFMGSVWLANAYMHHILSTHATNPIIKCEMPTIMRQEKSETSPVDGRG